MKVTAKAYRTPGSKIWSVDVTGDGIEEVTQARRLGEVETVARSVVALMHDVPPSEIQVTVQVPEADDVRKRWSEVTARADAARSQIQACAVASREIAREARESVGLNDAAFILGIGRPRVTQLTKQESN